MRTDKAELMTFDTFVVTDANIGKYNICQQLLSNTDAFRLAYLQLPAYERLHLKCAFENHFKNEDIFCSVSTKQYSINLIEEIQTGQRITSMERLESVRILLVDDLQYLVRKDATQDSFYYLLRHRIEKKKTTILFSECSQQYFTGELLNLLRLGLQE